MNMDIDRAQGRRAEERQDLTDRLGDPGHQGQAPQGTARGRQEGPVRARRHRSLQTDDRAQEADEHEGTVEGRECRAVHRRPCPQSQQGRIEAGQEACAAQGEGDEPGGQPRSTGAGRISRCSRCRRYSRLGCTRDLIGGGRTWVLRHTHLTFFHIVHRNKVAAGRAMISRRAPAQRHRSGGCASDAQPTAVTLTTRRAP